VIDEDDLDGPAAPLRRLAASAAFAAGLILPGAAGAQTCARTIVADVVALDQVFFWNRFGAVQPQGMMYALRRDVCTEVCPRSGPCYDVCGTQELAPGNVHLRRDKRPRPLVLRMNVGDCLRVEFQNLLAPSRKDGEQPNTRQASFHAVGLELVEGIKDDASFVGQNASSLADVGQHKIYVYTSQREGEHVVQSLGAVAGGEGDGGSTNPGLFGAVIVEPQGARWYRSQVTREDFAAAVEGPSALNLPILDYDAVYPLGHPRAGEPVLAMLDPTTLEILRSDLTAIIVGSSPNREETSSRGKPGWFPVGMFPPNVFTHPQRQQPFREFTIIYHDEIGAVQAFPEFEQDELRHTLHSGRDGFAINYGAAGIGAEVLANRFRVGPMAACPECKFEEFFLSSWVVGDPAMVVDVPANVPCGPSVPDPNHVDQEDDFALYVDNQRHGVPCTPLPNAKATKAFFPDDPSNVYHSYLSDHVRFRVLHGGSKEHHIHHLHAHQWLFNADSDTSSYLDSQAIGPGASFTAEIAHDGGGNLNKTVGDAIFHCHFYPHFAQGMWSLWRVHDVLEIGTPLDDDGKPQEGTRALPDGEIAAGTPIPGLVPLPGKPMPPLPEVDVAIVAGQPKIGSGGNPGYPFFVPARAGHRPPHPPLDTIHDGGLPRHRIENGTFDEAHTRLDFHKTLLTAVATPLDETGEGVELAAMAYHAVRNHPTCEPDGTCNSLIAPVSFVTNGRPAAPGAPYADPCIDVDGNPVGNPRYYKVADIQDDVKFNKKGWHFPQQRFSALWKDVDDYLNPPPGVLPKPPEPLFFRAASRDCIEYWLTNLVPNEYELDDFQVRTPTDILGQHIHLVKFDVTSSDGAANGFNYEDGTFSPEEVRERIDAIRAQNRCHGTVNDGFPCPEAQPHPFFGAGPHDTWKGAQTTVQRWYADPVQDNAGNDRTLRTVFTHDHFGPSTHQQAGLYAGLVIEPTASLWFHNENELLQLSSDNFPGLEHDGGPTSWQAVIRPENEPDYREFLLEFGDFQPAYEESSTGFPDPPNAVNPPGRIEIGLPDLLARPVHCPDGNHPPPCPELVSDADPGTMAVNYRQEPLALRVRDPNTNSQAALLAGDLSFAFSSNYPRADAAFNSQPTFYAPLTVGLEPRDPYTPLLRTYENDRVQIRLLVGAHEEGHNFSVHGVKWLFEPSYLDSGYRNSQMMGISEHFEMIVPQLINIPPGGYVDRLYEVGSATDDLWNGIWGLLRTYSVARSDLARLSENPAGRAPLDSGEVEAFEFSCPRDAPDRLYDITAVTAQQALNDGQLVYNGRDDGPFGPLFDPTAILFFRTEDLREDQPRWRVPIEPLVLRAKAGECIKITLRNHLPEEPFDLDGFNTLPMIVPNFNANDIKPSNYVGLHPQLVYYDVARFDGANIGGNPDQAVPPGGVGTYEWYAGDVRVENGNIIATPIEFGATNLTSSDRIEHASKGAIGALIIEPRLSSWQEDCNLSNIGTQPCTRTSATVIDATGIIAEPFREFVLLFQNDVNMRTAEELPRRCTSNSAPNDPVSPYGYPVENLACLEDPEDTGQKAINYRTEPLWKRMQHAPGTPFEETRDFADWYDVLSNGKVGGDPETPVFKAEAGDAVRFRVLQPGGHARNIVFALHGHAWDREPYVDDSTRIGHNIFSFWEGARMGHGPSNHFDAVLQNGAGGKFSIVGDYLFRDQVGIGLDNGLWGLLRVE
jgi:hypothetical protein